MFLMAMMILSQVAFLLLHYLPAAKKERLPSTSGSRAAFSDALQEGGEAEEGGSPGPAAVPTAPQLPLLLVLQAAVCFLSNGALPSIQSYSCLPYGNTVSAGRQPRLTLNSAQVYHLAVTLHAVANPLMAFLAFFLPCQKPRLVVLLAGIGFLLSGFIMATALASPATLGPPALAVLAWVTSGALFSYVKVCIAGLCRDAGQLFRCGVVTQLGSALGAGLMFVLVNEVGGA